MEITQLETLIDSEIEQYQEIEKLYIDKKEILVRAKSQELLQVDSKILNTVQNISTIAQKRLELSKKMNILTPSLSEIIGYLKSKAPEKVEDFEKKKFLLKDLSKRISTLEKTNLELTRHGLQFTNKTLEAILKGAGLSTCEYNDRGQNISSENLEMSSIVKEA